jgi:hypothetical protein
VAEPGPLVGAPEAHHLAGGAASDVAEGCG